jgi:Holliday junction DNA helicase RuvA
VRSVSSDRLIVEVGGFGVSVLVNPQTAAQVTLGSQVQLFTSLVVREDSLTLFGFINDESRSLFELVQTVSGIGPKVALSILGALTPEDLGRAISQEDIGAIEKVPGIGRKGAQRLILELKGKLSDFGTSNKVAHHQPVWREQLASALISLGFTAKESDNAITTVVNQIAEEGGDANGTDLSDLLKRALQKGGR